MSGARGTDTAANRTSASRRSAASHAVGRATGARKDRQCCKPFKCIKGKCRKERRCNKEGGKCTKDRHCCKSFKCIDRKCSKEAVCLRKGAKCKAAKDCCGDMVCDIDGKCGKHYYCGDVGETCKADRHCCTYKDAKCVNGICEGTCAVRGEKCGKDFPCCGDGWWCENGVCRDFCGYEGESCAKPTDVGCCDHWYCGKDGKCVST